MSELQDILDNEVAEKTATTSHGDKIWSKVAKVFIGFAIGLYAAYVMEIATKTQTSIVEELLEMYNSTDVISLAKLSESSRLRVKVAFYELKWEPKHSYDRGGARFDPNQKDTVDKARLAELLSRPPKNKEEDAGVIDLRIPNIRFYAGARSIDLPNPNKNKTLRLLNDQNEVIATMPPNQTTSTSRITKDYGGRQLRLVDDKDNVIKTYIVLENYQPQFTMFWRTGIKRISGFRGGNVGTLDATAFNIADLDVLPGGASVRVVPVPSDPTKFSISVEPALFATQGNWEAYIAAKGKTPRGLPSLDGVKVEMQGTTPVMKVTIRFDDGVNKGSKTFQYTFTNTNY